MTIVTLVDVIEIGFLFCPAHTLNPPLTPQTQRWFLQDLTITRGAFNQSGMQLGGASDGSGGRKGLITPSQSLSLVPFLFVPLLSLPPSLPRVPLSSLHFCFSTWSIPCDFSHRVFKQPLTSLPPISSPAFSPPSQLFMFDY